MLMMHTSGSQKCGHQNGSICITWCLVRNMKSEFPPWTYWSVTLGMRLGNLYLTLPTGEPAALESYYNFFFFFFFGVQGLSPRPLQWRCRVLTTGPPGKSPAALEVGESLNHFKPRYTQFLLMWMDNWV